MQLYPLKTASLLFMLLMLVATGHAAIDDYEFESQEQEARFRRLADEMRCPMCLNANLSGSDAPIAADLRREIHDQIKGGRSDREIIEFMSARYGDFILYRPPLNTGTFVLWFGPVFLLLLGFFIVRRLTRASASDTSEILSPEEEARLRDILAPSDSRK
jgi:cytochrome c-type biogenesis protein CcmH